MVEVGVEVEVEVGTVVDVMKAKILIDLNVVTEIEIIGEKEMGRSIGRIIGQIGTGRGIGIDTKTLEIGIILARHREGETRSINLLDRVGIRTDIGITPLEVTAIKTERGTGIGRGVEEIGMDIVAMMTRGDVSAKIGMVRAAGIAIVAQRGQSYLLCNRPVDHANNLYYNCDSSTRRSPSTNNQRESSVISQTVPSVATTTLPADPSTYTPLDVRKSPSPPPQAQLPLSNDPAPEAPEPEVELDPEAALEERRRRRREIMERFAGIQSGVTTGAGMSSVGNGAISVGSSIANGGRSEVACECLPLFRVLYTWDVGRLGDIDMGMVYKHVNRKDC